MSWSYDLTSVGVYGVYTDLGSKVIKGSFPVRIQKSLKMYLLLQTTCDIDRSWSYDSTSVGVYGVLSDLRSKVIKGSFPVRIQKSLKIHIC